MTQGREGVLGKEGGRRAASALRRANEAKASLAARTLARAPASS